MNKPEAIRWCFKNIKAWPVDSEFVRPDGWRWMLSSLPYRCAEYKLVNANFEEIREVEVF